LRGGIETSVPRVLLLTGTAPGSQGIGGIFLRDLCLAYPKENICCFSVIHKNLYSTSRDLGWLPISYELRPRLLGIQRFGNRFARLSGFFLRQHAMSGVLPVLAKRVAQFGRQHGVEMVWAVLNDPALFGVTRRVVSMLEVRLATTIWDPPESLLVNLGADRRFHRNAMHEFRKVLLMSERCGVASEAMGEEYRKRYGIEAVVLIHGIHPNMKKPPAKELMNSKEFTIGFAGSLYAFHEWQALISALSKTSWQIEGRDVIIRFLGAKAPPGLHNGMPIEYLGWRSVEETIELMSKVDIAYLPYWFDESHSLSVRLCFPNKLSTYLAAGRPVFFHGPRDSSPARFFSRFPVGLCCHSLEEGEIVKALRRFVTDKEFYALAAQAGQVAFDTEINLHVFRRQFASLIGIAEEQLF
jgi:hypothetical protein